MSKMFTKDGLPYFVYGISRDSLTAKDLVATIDALSRTLKINMNLLKSHPVSNRVFKNAISTFGDVSGDVDPKNFSGPLRSSVSELGYFLPCSAEAVSFIFYNVREHADRLPSNLICGIRRDPRKTEEIVLLLRKEEIDLEFIFSLYEIPASKIPRKGFEILLVKEHPEDPE
jgi:hypothetical protein